MFRGRRLLLRCSGSEPGFYFRQGFQRQRLLITARGEPLL